MILDAAHGQTVISGTYNGATISGDISIAASTSATFTGGTTFSGANATFNNGAGLYWQQVGTLDGKTLTFGSGAYLYINGNNNTLTLGATSSATGDVQIYSSGSTGTVFTNQGTLTHTGGTGSIYAPTFTNSGTISATGGTLYLGYPNSYNSTNTSTGTVTASGSGTTVYIRGNFANAGTLAAQNSGVLLFDGANTTANLGTVQLATGGRALLNGTITNTSTTLSAPSGGTFELYGGTISGGTVPNSALTFTSSGGYLDGATYTGNLTLPASTYVHFSGGATFSGTAATLGNNAGLYWDQGGTLSGTTLTLGSGSYLYFGGTSSALTLASSSVSFGSNAYIYLYGSGDTLTIAPTTTLTGDVQIYSNGSTGSTITNQGTISHTSGNSSIYAPTFTNSGTISATGGTLYLGYPNTYNSTNTSTGTVTASGSGTTVYVRGNFANAGTLTAQNSGVLLFDGTNTTANLGTVQLATGGRALLNGTITNTSTTLSAPSGGTFELYGGTISGGTVPSNALTFTSSGGYLDGATYTGNLTLPASTYVHFSGGATFSGTAATLGNNAGLYWDQGGTLSGTTLTLGSGSYLYFGGTSSALTLASSSVSFGSNAYIYLYGSGDTLTIAPTTTLTGDVQIYSNGSTGSTITNQGTISNTSGSSSIYAPTFTNSGTISATGGTLYLGYPNTYNSTNTSTGTVTADGSSTTVYVRGNFANAGTLTAQNSGTLLFDGTNTSANLGTVQLATGGRARLNGTITNTSATLAPPTGGSFELYGGTITSGTVASGALTFTSSGGYLDGATLNDNFALPASTYVRFVNGASFTGSTATLGTNSGLYWEQAGTLTGKALTLSSGAYLYVIGTNSTLTLAPTTTVTGEIQIYSNGSAGSAITNQGTITHTSGSSSIYAPTFTNSGSISATAGTLYLGYPNTYNSANTSTGTVTADGASTTVYVRGNFANAGTLTAQNSGTLFFDGTNTSANLGTVQLATGGRARLNGTITNTSATLAPPTGGSFELYGGTITSGTVASGALAFTSSGGYLDGATLNGNFTLPASAYVRFANGASFSGTTATLGTNSGLYWEQAGTLTGKALTLNSGAYLYVNGTNNALTLAPTTTVTGEVQIYSSGSTGSAITNQGAITHTGGSSSIYAPTFTNSGSISATAGTLYLGYPNTYNSANTSTGTVTADGSATTIYVRGNFANTGTLTAQNSGTLFFDGNNTSANLGTVQLATGGHARLNGTIANTSATLASPTGGGFELYGGTITGGTIATGALTFTNSGGYLDGTILNDNFTLPANSYVRLLNDATFTGSSATLGTNAGIYWQQSGTLSGKSLSLASGSYLYVSGANHTLTLGPTTTVTGDASIYADNSSGTAITNQGSIVHNISSGTLYAPTFVNSGSITASAGTLTLGTTATGATFANDTGAAIRVTGGAAVHLQLPGTTQLANQGTVDVQNGTFYTNNHLTNAAGGLLSGAGTVSGNVTAAGGTIAPGNSGIGTLTFQSGTLSVTAPSVLAIDLGGTTADRLVFQSPPSVVNIGTGLLSLSVSLASAPVDNTSYGLLQISTGGSGITGTFAGLPTSGNTLTAMYNGTPYVFAVNYQTNLVSLNFTAVPEPSTYGMMGFGTLALIGIWRRRRRR